MSLETIIHEGLTRPGARSRALVLMGGGARTAYQVGVLGALASLLRLQPGAAASFPFQILVGTSAGALNVAYLASAARTGLAAFDELRRFWGELHCDAVYRLDAPPWVRFSRLLAAVKLWGQARRRGAVLDTMPLVDTLHRHVSLAGDRRVAAGARDRRGGGLGSSYTTGVQWTFCHTAGAPHSGLEPPGAPLRVPAAHIEHLMASAPCPSCSRHALWVDGAASIRRRSMRQISPLSRRCTCARASAGGRRRPAASAPARRARRRRRAGLAGIAPCDGSVSTTLQATWSRRNGWPRRCGSCRGSRRRAPYRAIDVLAISD